MDDCFKYKDDIKKYSEGLGAITFITESYSELREIIERIKASENYRFNVGKPQLIDSEETVVLSISSIMFFQNYGLLDELSNKFDIHILNSTLDYFLSEEEYIDGELTELYTSIKYQNFKKMDKLNNEISTKEKYLDELDNIIDWIENRKVIEVYGEYEIDESIEDDSINYIDELFIYADLDSAQYASRLGYTILVDDYITSEIFREIFEIKKEKISNLAGFVNTIYGKDLKKYYEQIKELILNKYNYVIDKSSLLNISNSIEDGEYKDLDNILKLLVKSDVNGYYKMLIKDILKLDIM